MNSIKDFVEKHELDALSSSEGELLSEGLQGGNGLGVVNNCHAGNCAAGCGIGGGGNTGNGDGSHMKG